MASMFDRNIRGQQQSIRHVQYCVIFGGSPERVPGGGLLRSLFVTWRNAP